ncbi:uncharacterized protein LOC124259517 isoform X2 [Haliotis rubra]|uniref:uncharacterized protein LOC124259517 isoform X2 n=1 Tax=Haliotis rubra TaxID=36100 RepID=UPI001EE54821|nr:uncharacterized protein LOC124259517 isoform X2 [Haliotis rubra]
MSSRHVRGEKRVSKHLTVTSKCLAIVLAEKEKYGDENSATLESTVSVVHNGKELLEDFKLRNKTCYWNPALVESIRNLGYKGFVEPSTILVIGNEIHLENLRTAWGRRLLKAPAGFTIERIGDVNGIEMQVIPQTQFIPLPDALCLIIMDLNNRRIVATLDTIKEKLVEWYREMTVPNDQLIFDTLGALIRERKVFHSGTGYFVVTPETYRLTSDDQNVTFNTSWLPYHPMYIPVFPQIQNLPSQLQHLHHLQHLQHQQEHQQQQQQLHMRAPMRSISCQADMNGKAQAHHCPAGVGKDITENKKAGKQRPRSQSMRGLKTRDRDMDRNKATVIENDDALKRTISVRYKTDKVKAINKDMNLKTSNINQDKEKGEKEKMSLFSKIFGRNKKKNVGTPPAAVVKEVEYATFSAQFPPPEWHWYQQQVEKQKRTEEWVSQQIAKSCTLQYLHNMVPPDSTVNTVHQTEARPTAATNGSQAISRPHYKQQENNISNRKVHGRRHGTKSKKDKTNANEQNLRVSDAVLFVSTNHEVTMPTVSLSPVQAVDDDIYQSVIGSKSAGPRHSTPRFYDTIPLHRDVGGYREHILNNQDDIDQCSYHPHHQRRPHRSRRKGDHSSLGNCDNQHQSDISFEYKGRMPIKNSVFVQSRDSGVNCIGLSTSTKNNDHQSVQLTSQTPDPVIVRNKLDNLEEETQTAEHEFVHLNNTMTSEYQAEFGKPSMNNNCYDSSVNEENGGMQIVCEAEINREPIPEIVLDTEPHRVISCQDVAEPASNSGSRDALNSEKSYDTVVAVKKSENTSQSNDKKSDTLSGDVRELSLVDSGFSSPRNVNIGAFEPSKQSSNISEGCSDIKNHKQYMKTQPQVPHNSPKEKCPINVEHRHKHSTHMLNNHRHSRGYKYDNEDCGQNRVSKDLHVFQQQQLTSKRFGLNGEFEVVGVV